MSSTGLEGRGVIVTGGGSGIGRAAALEFADEGAKVLIADADEDGATQVVKTIVYAGGVARAVVGDLGDPRVVDRIVSTAVETFGGVDVLVHNAGVLDRLPAVADTDDDEWERVVRNNLTAPIPLTRAALPHTMAAGRGSIVFTASEASLRGSAAGAAPTASQHGVVGLTKSLAAMYRGHGIRTNAIAPGPTDSGIQPEACTKAHGPRVIGNCIGPAGKVAAAEEQAAAVVFLASDAASNINGAVLPVDHGWSAV
ncbi:SDR family NAD(P)-dependent oxidoreductase [Streptomyces mirabilis]|uniref:SDR family NAD(P)-dependent oxidoreductase n=1 Tax=Streptomyces mirabilis TaxID=68239 RepID=UPI00331751BC